MHCVCVSIYICIVCVHGGMFYTSVHVVAVMWLSRAVSFVSVKFLYVFQYIDSQTNNFGDGKVCCHNLSVSPLQEQGSIYIKTITHPNFQILKNGATYCFPKV